MITFFILYENYEYVNKVVTKINAECQNAMCIGITNKVNKKSIIFCKNEQPHVIIGSYASLETIKNDLNYEHISIPILSESIEFIKKISNQLKSLSQNCLYSHKLDLANYKKRIMNCLINLNFNPNLCGTRYILDVYRVFTRKSILMYECTDLKKIF